MGARYLGGGAPRQTHVVELPVTIDIGRKVEKAVGLVMNIIVSVVGVEGGGATLLLVAPGGSQPGRIEDEDHGGRGIEFDGQYLIGECGRHPGVGVFNYQCWGEELTRGSGGADGHGKGCEWAIFDAKRACAGRRPIDQVTGVGEVEGGACGLVELDLAGAGRNGLGKRG